MKHTITIPVGLEESEVELAIDIGYRVAESILALHHCFMVTGAFPREFGLFGTVRMQ